MAENKWWKEGIVYQIYLRSFKDSDGDGIGDLRGIISKLPYIKSLGIDIIWLNPFYKSPNDDNGYDVSDYCEVAAEYGTMQDFDDLLAQVHDIGIRLVIDGVFNHSSDEHPWFQQSRQSRTNPYRDYYHWWHAENGKPPHRFSHFDEQSEAWKYDPQTDAYYLHYFSKKQPDLNWENPNVRKAIYDILHFWLKKGVDGFRLDVISFISKDTLFPNLPEKYNGNFIEYYADGPHLHTYLQEMNEEVLSHYDCMTVGECVGIKKDGALDFVDEERKELNMFFHFDLVNYGYLKNKYKQPDPAGWKLSGFKKIFTQWDEAFQHKGWGSIYLGNHDQPRMVSRWGNDAEPFRAAASKMLLTFLLTMRGTPYIYMGDELGMTNIRFKNIEDYRDIETINFFEQINRDNGDTASFLKSQQHTARDNARTPFQWTGDTNAGFTAGDPWISLNKNASSINAELQEGDQDSVLNYFRNLVLLRKANRVLIYGAYKVLNASDEKVYAYTRVLGTQEILVVLNFTAEEVIFEIPHHYTNTYIVVINNLQLFQSHNNMLSLPPYQAVLLLKT